MAGPSFDFVMRALQSPGALYKGGHYEKAFDEVRDLWESLPGNKVQVSNAYTILEYAVAILLRLERLDEARDWANRGLAFRETRHDLGEAEFLIAKVAYEQGRFEEARDLIAAASKKSSGRILHGEDPKYRAMLRK